MIVETDHRMDTDRLEQALAGHTARATTCLLAVGGRGNRITVELDLYTVEGRMEALAAMGVNVDDAYGTTPWAIAFADEDDRVHVAGNNSAIKQWARDNFGPLSRFADLGSEVTSL